VLAVPLAIATPIVYRKHPSFYTSSLTYSTTSINDPDTIENKYNSTEYSLNHHVPIKVTDSMYFFEQIKDDTQSMKYGAMMQRVNSIRIRNAILTNV